VNIDVDITSPVPPYEQVRAQIADLAAAGALPVGARLPSIRQLASDLGLAPGTVARAYRELETDGVVTSRVRHGTTIAPRRRPPASQTKAGLASAARTYALAVRSLGMSQDAAFDALRDQFGSL
jgi:DNA-binding transcriptional regulator YhcF (GntR family)